MLRLPSRLPSSTGDPKQTDLRFFMKRQSPSEGSADAYAKKTKLGEEQKDEDEYISAAEADLSDEDSDGMEYGYDSDDESGDGDSDECKKSECKKATQQSKPSGLKAGAHKHVLGAAHTVLMHPEKLDSLLDRKFLSDRFLFRTNDAIYTVASFKLHPHKPALKRLDKADIDYIEAAIKMTWNSKPNKKLHGCLEQEGKQIFQRSVTTFGQACIDQLQNDSKALLNLLDGLEQTHALNLSEATCKRKLMANQALSGCYLYWGLNEAGRVEWLYVGRSHNIYARLREHYRLSTAIWPDADRTECLLYNLAKRSASLRAIVISDTNGSKTANVDNAVCEAIWCALLGTYQRDKQFVEVRAGHGLPKIVEVLGANSSRCHEAVSPAKFDRTRELEPLSHGAASRAFSRAFMALAELTALHRHQLEHSDVIIGKAVTEKDLAHARAYLWQCHDEFKASFKRNILAGTLLVRARRSTDVPTLWLCRKLFKISIKHEQASRLCTDGSSVINFRVHLFKGRCDMSDDMFIGLPEKERILYGGIKLHAFKLDDQTSCAPVPIQLIRTSGRKHDWNVPEQVLEVFNEQDGDDVRARRERSSSIAVYQVPAEVEYASLIQDCLNGTCKITTHMDGKKKVWVMKYYTDRHAEVILPVEGPLDELLGINLCRNLCILGRINFDSDYPLLPYRHFAGDDRATFSRLGLDVFTGDGSWTALRSTGNVSVGADLGKLRAVSTLPEILRKVRQYAASNGVTVREKSMEELALQQLQPGAETHANEPSFCRKRTTAAFVQKHGDWLCFIIRGKARRPSSRIPTKLFTLSSVFLRLWWPDRTPTTAAMSTEERKIMVKICNETAPGVNDYKLLVSKDLNGGGPWYDATAEMAFSEDEIAFIREGIESDG